MTSQTIKPLVGVILAGGLSRRMFTASRPSSAPGRPTVNASDKGLLTFGTTTMIGEVIAKLQPQVTTLIINANGDPSRFGSLQLPVVADPIDGFVGPLAGILAAFRWAQVHAEHATHVISVSSDAPFLPSDLVTRLAADATVAPTAVVLAKSRGELHPVIGCWPVCHADDLDRELRAGVRKVLRWTDRHGTRAVEFPDISLGGEPVDPFFNANTPEEFAEAQRLLAKMEG